MDRDDELLTEEEAAKLLDLKNPNTLQVWRSTNRYPELRYIRIGRRFVRYRRSDVLAFLRARTIGTEPEPHVAA